MKKLLLISLTFLLALCAVSPSQAQEDVTRGPVYIIQPGDTLWGIARKLHVSYGKLLAENDLTEDSSIHPGDRLSIPGFDSVSGVLKRETVPFGETLGSLSDRYQISEKTLVKLNRLTTPMELYAGVSVVLIGDEEGTLAEVGNQRVTVRQGQSMLEAAVEENINPWKVVNGSGLGGTWDILPGEVARFPGEGDPGPGGFPDEISRVGYAPEGFVQGNTMVFQVSAPHGTTLEGNLGENPLHFFLDGEAYVALQGISAVASPGLRTVTIQGQLPDGTPFAHRQSIRILSGEYRYAKISGLPPETVSMVLTQEEYEKLASYAGEAGKKKRWKGKFALPLPAKYNHPFPLYGERRSLNGSAYIYYHSGVDFTVGWTPDVDIYAAAPGTVVYVRNNSPIYGGVTLIDHGWGVYTAYAHQEEILVRKGQRVEEGEVIGKVGNTGRSTGPHLHWEVWVGGVPVDPMDWLEKEYP